MEIIQHIVIIHVLVISNQLCDNVLITYNDSHIH